MTGRFSGPGVSGPGALAALAATLLSRTAAADQLPEVEVRGEAIAVPPKEGRRAAPASWQRASGRTPGRTDRCSLADAKMSALRVWKVSGSSLAAEASAPVDPSVGLPPRALGSI